MMRACVRKSRTQARIESDRSSCRSPSRAETAARRSHRGHRAFARGTAAFAQRFAGSGGSPAVVALRAQSTNSLS
ncbi:hypothetical protein AQ610_26540 [Burkholderia humptydooensis]|nr:hypothetical protein AQ610_26540 [Burkholderia humptydooensis]